MHAKIERKDRFVVRGAQIYLENAVHDRESLILKKKKSLKVFKEVCKEETIFPNKTVCIIRIERNLSCLIPLKSNENKSRYWRQKRLVSRKKQQKKH